MANRKRYKVELIRGGGWGLYDSKRSMTVPVAVFSQVDNDIADRVCFFLNTDLSEEELLDAAVEVPVQVRMLSVDQFLSSIEERG